MRLIRIYHYKRYCTGDLYAPFLKIFPDLISCEVPFFVGGGGGVIFLLPLRLLTLTAVLWRRFQVINVFSLKMKKFFKNGSQYKIFKWLSSFQHIIFNSADVKGSVFRNLTLDRFKRNADLTHCIL